MAKLKKVSEGKYVILAADGSIIGNVEKLRKVWFAKPKGEFLPTHSAPTLAKIRQAIKGV